MDVQCRFSGGGGIFKILNGLPRVEPSWRALQDRREGMNETVERISDLPHRLSEKNLGIRILDNLQMDYILDA